MRVREGGVSGKGRSIGGERRRRRGYKGVREGGLKGVSRIWIYMLCTYVRI